MHASKKSSVDAVSFSSEWGPRLVRFYFLLCVNRAIAEAQTFETLSELVRSRKLSSNALIRLAVVKATQPGLFGEQEHDRVARAVAVLPRNQGCIVALSRGMGLSLAEIAEATGTTVAETKRTFTKAVLQLHKLLLVNDQKREIFREI